jgi:hypothetical protein
MGDTLERPRGDNAHVEGMNLQEAERALGEAIRNMHPDDYVQLERDPRPDPSDGFHNAYVKALYRHIAFLKKGVRYEEDGGVYHPV